jgi:hypothetical protein
VDLDDPSVVVDREPEWVFGKEKKLPTQNFTPPFHSIFFSSDVHRGEPLLIW